MLLRLVSTPYREAWARPPYRQGRGSFDCFLDLNSGHPPPLEDVKIYCGNHVSAKAMASTKEQPYVYRGIQARRSIAKGLPKSPETTLSARVR